MFDPGPKTVRTILRHDRQLQVVDLPTVWIEVCAGPQVGRRESFSLPRIRIGKSSENDLVLPDPSISRFHATLDLTPEGWLLTDRESTNGTLVRGLRVKQVLLEAEEECTLGEVGLRLTSGSSELVAVPGEATRFHGMIGSSVPMRETFALIRAVAPSPATVLVLGETGTGKEMVSRALHEESRLGGGLVTFDCASTQRDLIRAELFGHTRGAFTGATEESVGAFRRAHKGTLFLDEIGELPLEAQPNLLRVLETREVRPLGSDRSFPIDVRIVAATHRDLRHFVQEGRFRQDLYHRLRVVEITLPPLRERREDILEILAEHLEARKARLVFLPEAKQMLLENTWPGNVRELRNAIDRLLLTAGGRPITPSDLRFLEGAATLGPGAGAGPSIAPNIDQLERKAIEEALERHQGNRVRAAQELGISPATLYRRLQRYRGNSS